MKALSGKELCRILERHGWELKTIHGSHHIYMQHGRRERISVPVHANRSLKTGLMKAILKTAQID